MINIKLDESFSILSDESNFILAKKCRDRELHIGFFNNLNSLLIYYLNNRVRASNVKNIKQLIELQKSILASLNNALQPLTFDIELKTVNGEPYDVC